MGDMKFILFGALGSILLILSSTLFIASLQTGYNLTDTRNMENSNFTASRIMNITGRISTNVQAGQQTGTPTDDPLTTFVKGSYGAILLLFDFVDLFGNLGGYLYALLPEFGIPYEIVWLGSAAIILTICIIMFNAIFKTQG
jgi:hypothetical protein